MSNKNKNKKDFFVVVFFILISLFMLVCFVNFFRVLKKTKVIEKIGSINIIQGNAYIKNPDSEQWIAANEKTALSNNQQIFVSPNGIAELSFISGTKILFLENSLVEINTDQNQTVIKLKNNYANCKIFTTISTAKIITENKTTLLFDQSSAANVCVKNEIINASVVDGKIIVTSFDGVEKTTVKGSGFVLKENGGSQRKSFVIFSPMCFESYLTEKEFCDVEFNWNKNNIDIQFINIELFADKNMELPVFSQIADASKKSRNFKIPVGKYYWRCSAIDSKGSQILVPETFQTGIIFVDKK